jgi:hypothetical protein
VWRRFAETIRSWLARLVGWARRLLGLETTERSDDMVNLFSNYSESAAAHPPLDRLAPKPVSLAGKQATAVQDDGGGELPRGRTIITVNFANPTENEDSLDAALRKGPAGEGDVQADLTYDPVVVGKERVFAAGKFGSPGGQAKVAVAAKFGSRALAVSTVVGFAPGQMVLVENSTDDAFTFAEIAGIVGSKLELAHDLNIDVEAGALVRTANDVAKLAPGADYDWADPSLGLITIHDTPATAGKVIGVSYATHIEDFAGGEVYALPGVLPHPDYAEPGDIINDPAAEALGAWAPGETQFSVDRLAEKGFGRPISIYLIPKDDEATPNRGLARGVPVTVLPPIPTGVKTEAGNRRVTLFWDDLVKGGGLLDGYDVMRSDGKTFIPTGAKKLNAETIGATSFTDSEGAPNRVPAAEVPAPANCSTYSYAVVSKVATPLWDTPTRPTTAGDPGQPTAIKNLADA